MKILFPIASFLAISGGLSDGWSKPLRWDQPLAMLAGEETPSTVVTSGLVWEKPEVEMTAKLGEKLVRASYRFTNTSKNPISFVELTPSCGCVTAQINKLDYAPGESAVVAVTLDLEADEDLTTQDRSIVVTTNDAPKNPTTLRLVVHVPTAVETSAKAVKWLVGEESTTKDILVNAGPNITGLKLSLESENSDFKVQLKTETAGQAYRVSITPTSTKAVCFAQVRLMAEAPAFARAIPCEIRASVQDPTINTKE